jgi:PAS domain-containing protein
MLGIEVDDLLGTSGKMGGSWNAAEHALLKENIASRRPFLDFVYSRSNADGTTQYLQVSGEPMFDLASRFTGYRGIGIDVTERMRPGQQDVNFRSAIDMMDQGVCLVELASMRIIDANAVAVGISGYSRQQLLTLALPQLCPARPAIDDDLATLFERLSTQATVSTKQLQREDGSLREVTIVWRKLPVAGPVIIAGVIKAPL